jgi:hypothetical protein
LALTRLEQLTGEDSRGRNDDLMLDRAKAMTGYALHARDGDFGNVKDFYFDDRQWTIRYLVADTGEWLVGRQVLISPNSLISVDSGGRSVSIDLTKKQIEDSPPLRTDKPVSRRFEHAYYGFFGWAMYWGFEDERAKDGESARRRNRGDPDLRSANAVRGYHIHASDGPVGHVDDFIIDDEWWVIRYLIVDTRDWLPGKRALISPRWIERISWKQKQVFVALGRDAIQQAPEYGDESHVARDYEAALHDHYDSQGYWTDELPPAKLRR